jgi:hypothetical protein
VLPLTIERLVTLKHAHFILFYLLLEKKHVFCLFLLQ